MRWLRRPPLKLARFLPLRMNLVRRVEKRSSSFCGESSRKNTKDLYGSSNRDVRSWINKRIKVKRDYQGILNARQFSTFEIALQHDRDSNLIGGSQDC